MQFFDRSQISANLNIINNFLYIVLPGFLQDPFQFLLLRLFFFHQLQPWLLLLQYLHENSIPADSIDVHFLAAEGTSDAYSIFYMFDAYLAGVVLVDAQHDGYSIC